MPRRLSTAAAVTGCRCILKTTPGGKVETILKAEKPWTPTGVAVRGKDLFVLEYVHSNKHEEWAPRVRQTGAGRHGRDTRKFEAWRELTRYLSCEGGVYREPEK